MTEFIDVELPKDETGNDPNDFRWHKQYVGSLLGNENAMRKDINLTTSNGLIDLVCIDIVDFLKKDIPPRDNLLSPWLPRQGLAMVYAPRGMGKTHVSLGIAYAVASGGTFLSWKADKPAGVLFIDGEMPAAALQERLAAIVASNDIEPAAPLRFITPDLQELGMPNISSVEGQNLLNQYITEDIDLVIIDNLSCLARSGKENEGESWQPIQTWALSLRAKGKSCLFIHHAGKGGQQRGTSRREDVLDTVIALRRPSDYSPVDGACFEVHFEKSRGVHGDTVAPFEAKLQSDTNGHQEWSMRTLEDSTYERVVNLLEDGLSQKDIATELGINKSNVSRHVKRAKAEGRVS